MHRNCYYSCLATLHSPAATSLGIMCLKCQLLIANLFTELMALVYRTDISNPRRSCQRHRDHLRTTRLRPKHSRDAISSESTFNISSGVISLMLYCFSVSKKPSGNLIMAAVLNSHHKVGRRQIFKDVIVMLYRSSVSVPNTKGNLLENPFIRVVFFFFFFCLSSWTDLSEAAG